LYSLPSIFHESNIACRIFFNGSPPVFAPIALPLWVALLDQREDRRFRLGTQAELQISGDDSDAKPSIPSQEIWFEPKLSVLIDKQRS
jgi:hypothetical protein